MKNYTTSVLRGFRRTNSREGANQVPNINLIAAPALISEDRRGLGHTAECRGRSDGV